MAVALLGALAAMPASALITGQRISTDPYANPNAQHKTEVEPSTLAWGSTIVSGFQVGRIFDGGSDNIGFSTSHNRGVTWTPGFLPSTTDNSSPAGTYERTSDASVAYEARDNVWLISYLGLRHTAPAAPVDVLVSRSTDGGMTWGAPVVVAATGHFLDKNWTVCDNTPSSAHFGNCYTEFDDNTQQDYEQMSTSTDGGQTWGAGKPTGDTSAFFTPSNGAHGIGGQPLVQPNGTVVVPFVSFEAASFAFAIASFESTDGGATWSASTMVSEVDFHNPGGGIRADIPLPSAGVDRTGKVYVVWPDCRFRASCRSSDLVLSTSPDGLTWSPATRIPTDPVSSLADHFIVGLGVDRSTAGKHAALGLTYYYYPNTNCSPTSCQLFAAFISSANGGKTWSTKKVLAGPMQLGWLPDTSQGRMVGDYVATAVVPGTRTATATYAAALPPTGAAFDQPIYAANLAITGGPVAADAAVAAHAPVSRSPVRGSAAFTAF